MTFPAAFSTAVRPVLTGPTHPAEWLGANATALYLITRSGTVLAIVTHDAARLPCALVLATTAAELPLTSIAPAPDLRHARPASVGSGRVDWSGPAGPVTVLGAREWMPARVDLSVPRQAALDALNSAVAGRDIGLEHDRVTLLGRSGDDRGAQFVAVDALLGRGPGLTPSGDDLVAGFLLGARAFGRTVPGAAAAVSELAAGATTALSAQLLGHALRGECVPELAAVVAALSGRTAPCDAAVRLLAVGHTSGTALALGLLIAAVHLPSTVPVGGIS